MRNQSIWSVPETERQWYIISLTDKLMYKLHKSCQLDVSLITLQGSHSLIWKQLGDDKMYITFHPVT